MDTVTQRPTGGPVDEVPCYACTRWRCYGTSAPRRPLRSKNTTAVVSCGEEHFDDQHKDTLLNPLVLIEVLSDSTEAYDRGGKFAHYRQLESLRDYVLVSQTEPIMECFSRQADRRWLLSEARGLEATLFLPSLENGLALAEVYAKVVF